MSAKDLLGLQWLGLLLSSKDLLCLQRRDLALSGKDSTYKGDFCIQSNQCNNETHEYFVKIFYCSSIFTEVLVSNNVCEYY